MKFSGSLSASPADVDRLPAASGHSVLRCVQPADGQRPVWQNGWFPARRQTPAGRVLQVGPAFRATGRGVRNGRRQRTVI